MIRTAGIRDDDLVTLQLVGDLSYAWELVDSFTMDMQDGIKRDPALVGKLRATFLKVILAWRRNVTKFQNEFIKLSFLPKCEPKIVRISAL